MKYKANFNITLLEVWLPIIVALLVTFFWDYAFVFPVKLFAVLLHEISHAIMTILTGGTPIKILLSNDLSGLTSVEGGNLFLIASSGYLGSLLFGILIYLSSHRENIAKIVTLLISIVIIISSINLIEGGFYKFLGLLVAVILFTIPRFFNQIISVISLRIVGLTSCIYIIADIKQDLLTTTLRETDTQIVEYITGINSIYFGLLWLILSVVILYFAVRWTLVKTKAK